MRIDRPQGARRIAVLCSALTLCLFLGSCAFTPRVMLMKEFAPSMLEGTTPGLAGKRILVKAFTLESDIEVKWTETAVVAGGFEYREMTSGEEDSWDAELENRAAVRPRAGGSLANRYPKDRV